ncbi:hypothetical protein F130042H8_05140 [Enterocloster alcoholdehydrogenati]|uniref:Uncharacterized protein n=1 Tax=Enterocloster alcoholdehydrogenati TaxID=2547410 RepID=A0ABQ0ATU7_9FIRM
MVLTLGVNSFSFIEKPRRQKNANYQKEGIFMQLIGSRKLTWGICGIGILLAIVAKWRM